MSYPGGMKQAKHTDYDLNHPNGPNSIFAFAYLSPLGKFIYYIDGRECELAMEIGDVIICSGLLEHAGYDYHVGIIDNVFCVKSLTSKL